MKKVVYVFCGSRDGRVLINVLECAMRQNGIPEVLVKSAISLYEAENTFIRVVSG